MDSSRLEPLVRRHFRERAARHGLRAEAVEARYVFNWGGFENASFTVTDGARRYHLKLAGDSGGHDDLRAWWRLAAPLAERYRAPRVLDWVEIQETGYAGLLCEHLAARTVRLCDEPALLPQVVQLVERLHHDGELAAALGGAGRAMGARERVLDRYLGCIESDLAESGASFPVSAEVRAWMEAEAAELRAALEAAPEWEGVAAVPVHGDLWEGNLLVDAAGRWSVIDWDDLALGDAALDYAILLWPLLQRARDATTAARWLGRRPPGFWRRLALCLRANLLMDAIDPLADWVEVERWCERADEVKARKRAEHELAMAEYRRRYSGRPGRRAGAEPPDLAPAASMRRRARSATKK